MYYIVTMTNDFFSKFIQKINFKYKEPTIDLSELYDQLMTDPLFVIIVFFITIFSYIYFANEIIVLLLGLAYPIYSWYEPLMVKFNISFVQSFVKYLVVFTHIQVITSVTGSFNYYFTHLKIFIIIIMIYITKYRESWLTDIYNKIIEIDRFVLATIYSFFIMIRQEYNKTKLKNN